MKLDDAAVVLILLMVVVVAMFGTILFLASEGINLL